MAISISKNIIVLMVFLTAIVFAVIVPAVRTQQNCVTAEQYYQGQVETDVQYCTLETKIAAAKYRATSFGILDKTPFSNEERRIIQERFQHISFMSLAQFEMLTEDFPELELMTIDGAFISLAAYAPDMDKTHHLLLYGSILVKRRLLLEEYLGTKLANLKVISDLLLDNDGEALGLKGNPDTIYLCYWKIFVPGHTVEETVTSPLFLSCTEEGQAQD